MKISLAWLKKYVELSENISPEEIASKLTLHTCEVEKVEKIGTDFTNIVVGEIKEILPHPNADKLRITKTDVGGEVIQIVCGGSNLYVGMKCVVAKIGAKVKWHGTEEMTMEKANLRGEESNGMICSASEVGLENYFDNKEKEVVDLKDYPDLKAGSNLETVFGSSDTIFDIDNKSLTNRPDLWGYIGLAREVAAIFNTTFKPPVIEDIEFGTEDINVKIQAKERVPRFSIVKISNLKIEDSPLWMKKSLEASGVRAISNIVDITNFVMLELGQPMHAYDAKKVSGEFEIRLSKRDEKMTTLDEIERNLSGDEVLVCDNNNILGLGGVMGGFSSEISKDTTEIYLESANWTKVDIRKTGTRLGLRTEAVQRYEKGLDSNLTEYALKRAINLLKEICPGIKIESSFTDFKNYEEQKIVIPVSLSKAKMVSGTNKTDEEIIDYLKRLKFKINQNKADEILVEVPSFRATGDIKIEEDIVEEIARMIGYDEVGIKSLEIGSTPRERSSLNILERKIRTTLKSLAFSEVMTYSFISENHLKKLSRENENLIAIKNPLNPDQTLVRDTLLPRLIEILNKNKARTDLKLFEIGHVHFGNSQAKNELPKEEINLSLVLSKRQNKNNENQTFFELKGIAEALFKDIRKDLKFKNEESLNYLEVTATLKSGKNKIGIIGKLNQKTLANFNLEGKEVSILEISLSKLLDTSEKKDIYSSLPKFPASLSGLTLIVPEEVTIEKIIKNIEEVKNEYLHEIKVKDIYRGEQIGENKKSVVIDLTYLSSENTLGDSEISKINSEILKNLEKLEIKHR